MLKNQNENVTKILVSQEEIEQITSRLAAQISKDYENDPRQVVLLIILKGSVPFAADLMRKLTIPVQLEFMKVSSYGASTKSSGEIKIHLDLNRNDLENLDIIIIEDIIDTGRTLNRLTQLLKNRNAHSVKTCTMLDKPSRREVDFTPDYVGVQIPDEFVVGFGLDYNEEYRSLPYVGVLDPKQYAHPNEL
ncbi:MAG: hypoxanthine phosphoribosyltransferase [Clostridia bacterium]|nr:hypoxanthine phosphoribosyltransferase [Clostridia bacterium]MBQ3927078.1 hypoxanthine phosphoribosyltransferase [Clostridia bacterium]MBQ7727679.1 hypoxanthine phosphoribosyltransferase [Clostridia bacterium]